MQRDSIKYWNNELYLPARRPPTPQLSDLLPTNLPTTNPLFSQQPPPLLPPFNSLMSMAFVVVVVVDVVVVDKLS